MDYLDKNKLAVFDNLQDMIANVAERCNAFCSSGKMKYLDKTRAIALPDDTPTGDDDGFNIDSDSWGGDLQRVKADFSVPSDVEHMVIFKVRGKHFFINHFQDFHEGCYDKMPFLISDLDLLAEQLIRAGTGAPLASVAAMGSRGMPCGWVKGKGGIQATGGAT